MYELLPQQAWTIYGDMDYVIYMSFVVSVTNLEIWAWWLLFPFKEGMTSHLNFLSFDFQLVWVTPQEVDISCFTCTQEILVLRKSIRDKNLCLMSWHKTSIYGQLTTRTEPFSPLLNLLSGPLLILPSKGSHYEK